VQIRGSRRAGFAQAFERHPYPPIRPAHAVEAPRNFPAMQKILQISHNPHI